jgi:Flp pilus assembly protein TadG
VNQANTQPVVTAFRRVRGSLARLHHDERGIALIFYTLMLVGLLGIVAMVSDTGMAYANRRLLQNAVDGAALAGAAYLPNSPAEAKQVATTYANDNGVTDAELNAITDPAYQIQYTTTYNHDDTMIVSAQRDLTGGLRYLFGAGDTPIVATSSAIVAATSPGNTAGTVNSDLAPWAVSLSQLDTVSSIQSGSPALCTTLYTECALKVNTSGVQQGNFYALDYASVNPSATTGGNSYYRQNIEYGYTGPVAGPTSYTASGAPVWSWSVDTKTGNMPNLQTPLDQLLSWDNSELCKGGSESCATLYQSPPAGLSMYPSANTGGKVCYTDVRCPRVAILPIISQSWQNLNGSSTPVTVVNFGCFYITRYGATSSGNGSIEVDGMFLSYCNAVNATPVYGAPLTNSGSIGQPATEVVTWR